MKQHKWHKEIKAWADGAEIEYKFEDGEWSDWLDQRGWFDYYEFRIKPQPKEIVEDELFEKFWTTEIVSAVTGNIDYSMWGKIDKDITQSIFNYGRKYERKYGIKWQPKKILDEIGEAEIKQMLDDIEYYQKRVEELERIHKDWVMICKKCGDDLGIVYEPKEPQYLYVYRLNNEIRLWDSKTPAQGYIGKIKLEVDE